MFNILTANTKMRLVCRLPQRSSPVVNSWLFYWDLVVRTPTICSSHIFSGDASYEIVIEHIFDSCDCCAMTGQLVPDGHWIVRLAETQNVTCIKGQLYLVDQFKNLGNY